MLQVAICMQKNFCETAIAFLSSKKPEIKFHSVDYSSLIVSNDAQQSEILFVDGHVPHVLPKLIPQLPKLQWVQWAWAGIDSIPKNDSIIKSCFEKLRFTRMGNYGPILSEFVIGQIVCWERKFLDMRTAQLKSEWRRADFSEYRPLSDLTVAIIGVGKVGFEIARICKQFGMNVHGLLGPKSSATKNMENVDVCRKPSELAIMLAECDYLVNCLPSTSNTKGFLGNGILKHCQTKKPKFINIGRGDVISEQDLLEALNCGYISGATLDVFEQEPLPTTSSLWTHEKVVISPHVAGVFVPKQCAEFFLDNLSRFQSGEKLMAEVDWKLEY